MGYCFEKWKRHNNYECFSKMLNESNCKPMKFTIDQWNRSNDIEMYSMHNEGKSVIAERFITTLKNKIFDFNIKKHVYW